MTFISKALFYIRKEPLFFITLILTLLLSVLSRPHFSAIHWNVIATLFSMMLICGAFEQCKLLDSVAELALGLFKTPRKLGFAMILTTGLLSMFVTNDIALLTVVPLTMMMANLCGKDPLMLVILETMSANLFSAATPFGNPQNLYLYSYFHIPAGQFFKIMLPFFITGAVLLILLNLFFNKGDDLQTEKQHISVSNHRLLCLASAAFAVNILSVLRIIDFRISLVATILVFVFVAPKLFLNIDYFLLLTFVLFFYSPTA